MPQDIYKLVNTDFDKLLLDANKVIGDETLISQISSGSDEISDDINNLYIKASRATKDDENDLNVDLNTCSNRVNEFKDYVSKYSTSFIRKLYDIYNALFQDTAYFKGSKEISKDAVKSNIDAIKNNVRITNAIKQNYNTDIKNIKALRNSKLKDIRAEKHDIEGIYSKNSLKARIDSLYLRYLSIELKLEYIKKKEAINIASVGIKTSYFAATHIIAFLKKIESGKLSDEELIKYADDKLYGIPQKIIKKIAAKAESK